MSAAAVVKSGQFNYDAVSRECPAGFTKITEGTTAVLEPPPKEKASSNNNKANGKDVDGEEAAVDDQAVFYNPAQVVNRDLSISAIELFSRLRLAEPRRRGGTTEGITILEALSATGLRAIRYYKEITNVRYIIANDMDSDAVDCIVRNCAYNGVPVAYPTLTENMPASAVELYTSDGATEKESAEGDAPLVGVKAGGAIVPNLDDANDLMFRLAMNANVHPGQRVCLVNSPAASDSQRHGTSAATAPSSTISSSSSAAPSALPSAGPESVRPLLQQELMDVVDLDPYGSASPFLDGAFRCIKEGGLMLVTSTDSAILCGNFADTAHAKYSSLPYKASHCHEAAVRTLLACIERAANKHKKYIVPLLSFHIDFYVRCFFRVYTQPAEVKLSACKLGYQLQCSSCCAFWVRPMATARQPRPSRQDRRRQKREHNEQQRQSYSKKTTEAAEKEGAEEKAVLCQAASRESQKRAREPVEGGEEGEEGDDTKHHRQQQQQQQQASTMAAADAEAGDRRRTEVYPAIPSRQSNPKLTPLTLQQLPQSHTASPSSPAAEATTPGPNNSNNNTCPVCGANVVLSGPIYAAPTQNRDFLQQLLGIFEERAREGRLNAEARITGLVRIALEELPDCPLFYLLPDVASYVRVRCPPTPYVVAALARLGYRCSQVHCAAAGLKTDAPPEVLFGVMLQWKAVQDAMDAQGQAEDGEAHGEQQQEEEEDGAPASHPLQVSSPSSASQVARAEVRPLLVAPLTEADFTYDKAYDFRGRVIGVAKFVPNAPGWGPRRRHQGAAQVNDADAE